MSEGWETVKNNISEYRERFDEQEEQTQFNGETRMNFAEEIDDSAVMQREILPDQTVKQYDDMERARKQRASATNCLSNLPDEEIIFWDNNWLSLGKLKDLNCANNSQSNGVGIIRLLFNGNVVYLVRAIDLNSGGLFTKLNDLQKLKINKRLKVYIEQHIDDIYVDILCTGNDANAVDMGRCLEKIFLEKYKPSWM